MITDDIEKYSVDFGLHLITEENGYTVMCGDMKKYPYGGIVTELYEMDATKIKDAILEIKEYFPYEKDSLEASEGFFQLFNQLKKLYGLATSAMIQTEFLGMIDDYKNAKEQDCVGELLKMINGRLDIRVKEFILEGTGYDDFGFDDFGQFLLTAYANFADSISSLKYSFSSLLNDNRYNESDFDSKKGYEIIASMCTRLMRSQDINFRILRLEDGFKKMYTVNTVMSLLLFEVINCMENNVQFTKCENCGKIFVPEGRKDTKYCSNPSPQNPDKTCREIGAQVARANKEKNDVVTKKYRKKYLSHKMRARRHPGDIRYSKVLNELTTGMKEWRIKLKEGSATVGQFEDWISKY